MSPSLNVLHNRIIHTPVTISFTLLSFSVTSIIFWFSDMLLILLVYLFVICLHGGGLVAKFCLTLVTPWTIAHQASLSIRFPRQEYWSGYPLSIYFSRGISLSRDWSQVFWIIGRFFTNWATRVPIYLLLLAYTFWTWELYFHHQCIFSI